MKSLARAYFPAGCILAFVWFFILPEIAAAEMPPAGPRVALRMESEPAYELRATVPVTFPKRLLPLWLRALDSEERDLHRQVGDAIVQAHRLGMKGLDQSVADRLRKAFQKADHPVVRRSLASALVELDDREAAESLWDASRRDYQLALIVEPALGRWKYQPAVEDSLARLENSTTPPVVARLAIELLGNAREEQARGVLLSFALSPTARGDLRLAAADSLAEIFSKGLVSEVRELADRDRSQDRFAGLVAVRLLENHIDAKSIALLQNLARDENSAVQALALKRLGQIDHKLAAEFALDPALKEEFSVKHPDANVRRALIESLYSIAEARSIPALRTFLDDPHPENRTAAGDALYQLAKRSPAFLAAVEQETAAALAESSWRTLERAAVLTGGLDFEKFSEELIGLLDHRRKDVAVASAWALKEIAVPETLPVVLKQLEKNLSTKYDFSTKAGLEIAERAALQSAHLNEQLGLMNYQPAEPTLRRFIPMKEPGRQIDDATVRATAFWALGLLHKDKPDPQLAAQFMSRLAAIEAMFNTEPEIVGEGAAYAVGWMRDPSALGTLKRFAHRGGTERNAYDASAWAVGRITGKPQSLPDPLEALSPAWFLKPTRSDD